MSLPSGNRVLDGIGAEASRTILARASVLQLERDEVTTVYDHRMLTVDFPVTALLSVMGQLPDGSSVEVTNVGSEDFVEIDAALHHAFAKRTSMCQFPGTIVRVPIDDFTRSLQHDPTFADLVYHAVRVRAFVTEQLVLCGERHSMEQRLARWLLMTAFKLRSWQFVVTHESLAGILGVRRASVSIVAKTLQDSGTIRYSRGQLTILEPARLRAASCSCYDECVEVINELL